ncbi:Intradiol ring-cleavage dioxygenase [Xylariales sp. PMI_506]|nr:Intradiol ring-cleavage dioxygenase [Xylariales sp. PMI_506]
MRFFVIVVLGSALVAHAHPGEHHEQESSNLLLARREHQAAAARGLKACQNKRSFQEVQRRAIERRATTVNFHRKVKRVDATGTGHNFTGSTDVNADSDDSAVFGDSPICILNPEGETGPYYVKGELVRSNLREDQPGVPIVIEGQFIDVETCEPITGLYWDIWNCNATGVYSGLVANGNGNTDDTSNLDNTFLRGIQETDDDGVVQFESIFPGHYSGRATHHHIVAWLDATVLPNNTLTSGYAAHIGQVFWDQDLIYDVEATSPYNENTITITENADDRVIGGEVSDTDSDPFFSYVYLGDSLADGLFGWLTVGINTSATYAPNYSFEYTEDGGVALSEQVGTDNIDGGGGPMTGSPGGFPNGTAAATAATTTATTTTTTTGEASSGSTASSASSASATASSNASPVLSPRGVFGTTALPPVLLAAFSVIITWMIFRQ